MTKKPKQPKPVKAWADLGGYNRIRPEWIFEEKHDAERYELSNPVRVEIRVIAPKKKVRK
ncbi:MAG: hypothetical protein ING29_00820 [Azospirillum sp.]|nr:hypothetical protein [Azospirillum sp.]